MSETLEKRAPSDKALELARLLEKARVKLLQHLTPSSQGHFRRATPHDFDWYMEFAREVEAALLRPHVQSELFGRAMVVLKGLSLAVEWELHPSIKKEIDAICAEFESAPAPGGAQGGGMTIAAIVLWMAMQGQAGCQGECDKPYSVQLLDYSEKVTCQKMQPDGTTVPAPCVATDPAMPQIMPGPGEHVIEIRTKRETTAKVCREWPETNTIVGCECPYDTTEVKHPSNFAAQCIRVTREVWIDGQKWGVLKETEEK